jgi:hypothetical protein
MSHMDDGICSSLPPKTLKCCNQVDTRDQFYMFRYVNENMWGNNIQGLDWDYKAILKRHYDPLWNTYNEAIKDGALQCSKNFSSISHGLT